MSTQQLIRPFWFVGALLMMLDGLTTYLALSEVGPGKEGNPLAVWAVAHIGLAGMCTAKGIIGTLMVWRLAVLTERGHRWEWLNHLRLRFWRGPIELWRVQRSAAIALAGTLLIMGVVVGNNTRAVLQIYGVGS